MITIKRVIPFIKGSKLLFCASIVLLVISVFFELLIPTIIQVTVDSILGGQPLDTVFVTEWFVEAAGGAAALRNNIWLASGILIIITVLTAAAMFGRMRAGAVASENIGEKLRDSLFSKLLQLPYGFHIKAKTGDLIQRCTSDVGAVQGFFGSFIIENTRALILIIISIAIMVGINITMTFASFAVLPVILIFSWRYRKLAGKAYEKSAESEGELSTVLQENLSGVRVVRAFGREDYETEKFIKKNNRYADLSLEAIKINAKFYGLSNYLVFFQLMVVTLAGAFLAYSDVITVGELIMFNTYSAMLIWTVRNLGSRLSELARMKVSLNRIYEILDEPEEADAEEANLYPLKGDIVFENVAVSYEPGKPIIDGFNLSVKQGETIGVLGKTGSGKSTLMHLLLRLYEYDSGSIKINGIDLKRISKKWLREKIGIVLQDPFLFSGTIMKNIRMSNESATDEAIFNAADAAAIHTVIKGFEKGYDTIVGERGITLSGGERQRVAIARNLVKNSDILIFDDSLSAVDTETDIQIRKTLKETRDGITTFIISQRITTLMSADKIIVLENGAIADIGTHQELIAKEGFYKRIWNIQTALYEDLRDELDEKGGKGADF